jgi:type II secretory pathway component GspD/PulD (secretin)
MKAITNLLLAFAAGAALAQGSLEVIPLKHCTAEQVIPVLRPLLEPGGALTGQYNTLIARTSPGNLAQIRAALEAIDAPVRRLVISVRFDSQEDAAARGVEGGARISNRGSSAQFRSEDSRSALGERVDQRIQVLEGGRAVIASGETRPLRQRQVIQTPSGPVVQETTVIQGAATGFEVVPRVSGSMVLLEIAPQREQFAPGVPGAIQSERVVSTVSGRLGEWFEIGGSEGSAVRQDSGILSQRETQRSGSRRIWVKVEEAGN